MSFFFISARVKPIWFSACRLKKISKATIHMMLFMIIWIVLIEIMCLPALLESQQFRSGIHTPYFKDENIDSQRG